jgi:uncharacterized protein (TIGR02453 family)
VIRLFNGFPSEAFEFFEQLALHNDREWFHAHQELYDRACREPMKHLVAELGANPTSTKVSRINRDMRFARKMAPYRTYIAAGVAGNYISLSAAGVYVGAGLYKPEGAALERFRGAIDSDASGRKLQGIVTSLRRRGYQVDTHERLTSAPRGYSADHPRIELLLMKGIFAGRTFAPEPWLSTRTALQRVKRVVSDVEPLVDWLRAHVLAVSAPSPPAPAAARRRRPRPRPGS